MRFPKGDKSAVRWVLPAIAALLGMVFIGYLAGSLLSDADWNPTVLLKFGEESPELAYGQSYFEDIILAPDAGHDGKYYLMQASDPFYLNPDEHAAFLDRPTYRAQRMLYPTISGLFGLLSHQAIAWGLILVNVVAIGAGTFATAILARSLGISPLFGLAFAFNPGVFIAGIIDTAEVVAMAALMFSLCFYAQRRAVASAVSMTFAVMSRETMVLAALGLVAFELYERRKVDRWMVLPFVAPLLWWLYLRGRIGHLSSELQDTAAVGPPLEGFRGALDYWLSGPGNWPDLMAAIVLLMVSAVFLWRAFRNPSFLAFSVGGFALLATVISAPVWEAYFDSTRVLAPLLTAYMLMVPIRRRDSGGEIEETESLVGGETLSR